MSNLKRNHCKLWQVPATLVSENPLVGRRCSLLTLRSKRSATGAVYSFSEIQQLVFIQ